MLRRLASKPVGGRLSLLRGRGKKNKSCDALANMEARLAKVELAMADTRERVVGIKDLREHIQEFRERVLVS